MKTRGFARLCVGMLCASSIPVCAQRQPQTFFKDVVKLSDREIQTVDQGQVVTKVLSSQDKYGMLVFGAVYVNGRIDKFADAYRDVEKLTQNKVYLAVGEFARKGSPVKLSDFDRLEFNKSDIDKVQNCKPGDCDLQVMNIEGLQKRIDWKSPDRYTKFNQEIRRRVYAQVDPYMKGGLKALGSYVDRAKPLDLYQTMKDMVDASYYIPKDKVPDIYNHVVDYPDKKMTSAEDFFYWEKIDFGQGEVVRINHVSLFAAGFGPVKLIVANKQLYADKYMRTALQMSYCVPDTENPSKPGFYLIEMSDSRLPDFGALKLGIVRKIATSTAVAGTRDTLEIFRKWTTGGRI